MQTRTLLAAPKLYPDLIAPLSGISCFFWQKTEIRLDRADMARMIVTVVRSCERFVSFSRRGVVKAPARWSCCGMST